MSAYLVTFERIGRNHNAKPLLAVDIDGPNHLAEKICNHARPYLASRGVDVDVDLETMTGQVYVGGFRPVGAFTIAEAGPDRGAA